MPDPRINQYTYWNAKEYEVVFVELEPGDAIFWHANLLHTSETNDSDEPRWSFICCYNTARNTTDTSFQPVVPKPRSLMSRAGEEHFAALAKKARSGHEAARRSRL